MLEQANKIVLIAVKSIRGEEGRRNLSVSNACKTTVECSTSDIPPFQTPSGTFEHGCEIGKSSR